MVLTHSGPVFFLIYSLPHTLPYFLHLISILTEHRNTLASVCFAEIHRSKFLHATLCAIYQLNKSLDKKKILIAAGTSNIREWKGEVKDSWA